MVAGKPIPTHGLTHIALAVKDVERTRQFYTDVFGMVAVYSDANFVQMQTPGARDVLVFERAAGGGESGGIRHFGFRLVDPVDIDAAADAITRAGGTITDKGEFIPGEPYIFCRDPDGYEVEVWFEIPTSVDPEAEA